MQQYQTFAGGYGTLELDKLEEKYAGFGGTVSGQPDDNYLVQLWSGDGLSTEQRLAKFIAKRNIELDEKILGIQQRLGKHGEIIKTDYTYKEPGKDGQQWKDLGEEYKNFELPDHIMELKMQNGKLTGVKFKGRHGQDIGLGER